MVRNAFITTRLQYERMLWDSIMNYCGKPICDWLDASVVDMSINMSTPKSITETQHIFECKYDLQCSAATLDLSLGARRILGMKITFVERNLIRLIFAEFDIFKVTTRFFIFFVIKLRYFAFIYIDKPCDFTGGSCKNYDNFSCPGPATICPVLWTVAFTLPNRLVKFTRHCLTQ